MKNKKETNSTDMKKNVSVMVRKIGDFFSTEPQKEKVLSHEDFNVAGDTYYASVSASYKVAQRILIVALVVFIAFSLVTNAREITYDNFYYLIKDFTSASDVGNNTYETLSYESDARQRFVLYRGGIASVSPSKISIFTATGRRTLNKTSSFSSPFAVTSDRYVLFYDTAGTTFSIYNSFSRIYSEELPKPVKCASIADDGSFAVVTENERGYQTTRIYTKNFDFKAVIPSSDYIFSIALDSGREKLSVLSYDSGNGIGVTKLSVYDLSKMKDSKGNKITLDKELEYDGEFPIKCGFTDNNTFAVITDSRVRILNKNFEEKNVSDDYSGGSLTGFFLNSDGVAVSVIKSSTSKIISYDKSGNKLYSKSIYENVLDIGVYGKFLFLQTARGVIRIDAESGDKEELLSGQGKMLIYNGNTVLVCGESKAEYLVFSK